MKAPRYEIRGFVLGLLTLLQASPDPFPQHGREQGEQAAQANGANRCYDVLHRAT